MPFGGKVAFELERARKSKTDYANKIKRYVQIIRSNDLNIKKFDRVHYVCLNPSVAELLRQETKIYGDLFQIQTTEEFFKTHNIKQ